MTTWLTSTSLPRSISRVGVASPFAVWHIEEVVPSMQFEAGKEDEYVLERVALDAVIAPPEESYAVTSIRLMAPELRDIYM